MPKPVESLHYLGPEGSYSYAAVSGFIQKKLLAAGDRFALKPEKSLNTIVKGLASGDIPLAVIPVENALEGSVAETLYGLMVNSGQAPIILSEGALPIRHCLITHTDGQHVSEITDVTSHPQALGQCQNRLRELLGDGVTIHAATSTSEAVSTLKNKPRHWAAIGSVVAAKQSGCHVLVDNMSDVLTNQTRFWLVVSPAVPLAEGLLADGAKHAKKTSICIGLKDRPGVLVDMLLVFKAYGLTMTRIESRPARRQLGDYLFFIDVAGNLHDDNYNRVKMYLEADSTFLRISTAYVDCGLLD